MVQTATGYVSNGSWIWFKWQYNPAELLPLAASRKIDTTIVTF